MSTTTLDPVELLLNKADQGNLIIKNQTDNNSKNNFALIEFDPIKYKKIFEIH